MGGFPAQYLKHGKALCGKAFGMFVETFNALVDIAVNISGDADGNNGQGHVHFDRSDPLHPVIRCGGCDGQDVTASENSGIEVTDGNIDIRGRKKGEAFSIRTITADGVTVRVIAADPSNPDDPDEEDEPTGDDGHPKPEEGADADEPDPSDAPPVDPGENPDAVLPDGGVPDCGGGGGVPAYGGGVPAGGVPAGSGEPHSGDGCSGCD